MGCRRRGFRPRLDGSGLARARLDPYRRCRTCRRMAAERECRRAGDLRLRATLGGVALGNRQERRIEELLRFGRLFQHRGRSLFVLPAGHTHGCRRCGGLRPLLGQADVRILLHRPDADTLRPGGVHLRPCGRQAARELPPERGRRLRPDPPARRGRPFRLHDGQLLQTQGPAPRQFAHGHDRRSGGALPPRPAPCARGELHLPPPHREPAAQGLRQDRPRLRVAARLRGLLRQARGLRRERLYEGERNQAALRPLPRRVASDRLASRPAADPLQRMLVPHARGLLRPPVAHDGGLHRPRRQRTGIHRAADARCRTAAPHPAA